MPSLVSDNFRVFAAEQFMESLEEPLDSSGNPLSDSSTEALRDRSKVYILLVVHKLGTLRDIQA